MPKPNVLLDLRGFQNLGGLLLNPQQIDGSAVAQLRFKRDLLTQILYKTLIAAQSGGCRRIVWLAAQTGHRVLLRLVLQGQKQNYSFTLRDLRVNQEPRHS